MSDVLFQKLLSMFAQFILLIIFGSVTTGITIVYVLTNHILLYVGFLWFLVLTSAYGVQTFRDYRHLSDTMHLYVPQTESQIKMNPGRLDETILKGLDITARDPIQFCSLYSQGCTLFSIGKQFDLDPQQVKRIIQQGLKTLLESYAKTRR